MKLQKFGWNEKWEEAFTKYQQKVPARDGLEPARVSAVFSDRYLIQTESGEGEAQVSGKMIFETLYAAKNPTVGDWVVIEYNAYGPSVIQGVLPRRSCLQRQEASGIEAQLLGANVDLCILVQSLVGDFNIARLDRYIAMVWDAGSIPMIVLTKADLISEEEMQDKIRELEEAFPGVDVHGVSAITNKGIDALWAILKPSKTYMVLGSSGVGKSTLLNIFMGKEIMATQEVREFDQRGRHTTTHRQMFPLTNGALYIDTPGMREIGLFTYDGLDKAFEDVSRLAEECKFTDCKHEKEPRCAVQKALETGELTVDRWESYLKLKAEEKVYRQKQIKLQKKVSKAKIKRQKTHYKDFRRGGRSKTEEIAYWQRS